jgi:hypothetical protein
METTMAFILMPTLHTVAAGVKKRTIVSVVSEVITFSNSPRTFCSFV